MAPEVMRKEEINMKVDVYSIGVIIWELITREDPFVNHEDYDIFVDSVCNAHERPIIPRWCPKSIREVIVSCWQPDQEARPAMSQVITMLDDCLADCEGFDFDQQVDQIIKDKTARTFWKKNFPNKLSVGWNQFVVAFYKAMDLPVPSDPVANKLRKSKSSAPEMKTPPKEQLSKRTKSEQSSLYRTLQDEGEMDENLRKLVALKMLLSKKQRSPLAFFLMDTSIRC